MNPIRKAAVDIVYNVIKKSVSLNSEISKCRRKELSDLDVRFISEITSGVFRNLEKIDYLISYASDIKINKISPYVLAVLRTGVYQIIYMDKIPKSAAVNESVEIIKKSSNKRLSGFVNAVLHKVIATGINVEMPSDKIKKMSVEYSCPEWIVKHYNAVFKEETEDILASMNFKPETILRVNTLKTNADELIGILNSEGWECSKYKSNVFEDTDYLITASKVGSINNSTAYKNGLFYIQDTAAAYASHILSPKPDSTVLDVCAAPGGKTTHIAQIMKNRGKIIAFDLYDTKIKLIEENAKRLGIDIILAQKRDSTEYYDELKGTFDYILADVPCSGLGIVRRKPDIKYLRKEDDINALCDVSAKILDNCAAYLKNGGKMLFSTCTLTYEENKGQLFSFLKRHSNFKLRKINCMYDNEGYITLTPNKNNCDGFFISLLEKENY